MRRILIDRARHKQTAKAGGDRARVDLDAVEPTVAAADDRFLALDDALRRLEAEAPRKAERVEEYLQQR